MRIMIAAVAAASLAGCATFALDDDFATRVMAHTQSACGYLPTAHVIAQLRDDPRLHTAVDVAGYVCALVAAGQPPAGTAVAR